MNLIQTEAGCDYCHFKSWRLLRFLKDYLICDSIVGDNLEGVLVGLEADSRESPYNSAGLRSSFELFEMFFKEKKSSFSSRFFSQIRPLSSLEEAVETEVFHSQHGARAEGNRTCPDCRGEQQGKRLLLTFKQTIQNRF